MVKVLKSKEEWQAQLSKESYKVTREHGTERAGTSPLNHEKRAGAFYCICCDEPLFSSTSKYESGSGWPSFYAPIKKENVLVASDNSHGMSRDEVMCNRCGAHLGHVFDDGPKPTGKRFCMNAASLSFVKK